MAVSSELMYAILAMDSYNRGYNPGIEGGGIGFSIGDGIGNATVVSEDRSSDAQDTRFYAVAYEWNSETIISYRGTHSKGELLGTPYPIAVNDDYEEVRVFSSRRIPDAETSSGRKSVFWKRAEA